ncbi:nephrocystin-1-like isoform X3 [Argiope bruennichi]|uniref:nephrocystin-1-like isoform X3 n=1 Tax=Argiope bruennichi TaxID=94029 RepID=UPI0024954976|nr:nephrocystin-1-like isoform X3 [Argiope bruennichi]
MTDEDSDSKDDDLQNMTFVCVALHDFRAEQTHDLSFQQGELLTVTGIRDSGWWEAKNDKGETGLVPSTFLKIPDHVKSKTDGTLGLETEKNVPFSDSKSISKKPENSECNEDFITDETEPPRILVDRFSELSINHDVLPEGFRHSMLFDLAQKDSHYIIGNFMAPKLDESGIAFKDICYDKTLLKPNSTLLQKKISLIAARQIPEPPNDFIVKSRHIRMCFHDGNKQVLSNIHTVKAKWNKSSPKLWMFNSKVTPKDSCVEEGEIFIKCNECVPTLGILFELCISYEHVKGTSGEMCSGWAFMKLLNDSGEPVKSKTNILKVQDTEPFTAYFLRANSQGITGFFKKIKDKQKLPRIVISICDPDRPSNQQMSFLPSSLIGPWSCIAILSLSRKIIAEDLLERSSFDSSERILSPVLASLPHVLNDPDLLDALRISWTSVMKNLNTDDIRMDNMKKKTFRDLFCETVFVIANSNNILPLKFEKSELENARKFEIKRLLHIQEAQEKTLPLSEELEFSPFSLKMISANIINFNEREKF